MFSIEFIPRAQNTKADSLAVSASLLLPHPKFKSDTYRIEMIYRPRVPDNVNHWQVFNDDEQLKEFIACVGDFAENFFEGSEHSGKPIGEESTEEGEVIQLQGNRIPKGLVSLEHLFGRKDDSALKRDVDVGETKEEHDKINIGTDANPKMIAIGKTCSVGEKEKLTKLLTRYQDVFAWGYGDLKNFRNGEFVHHIPLKPGATTFRQKLRNYNPKVLEAIFREVEKMLKARIIYLIHHSTWVANIVPVRKKNGEIRICVDFRNLNQASLKDNYALPTMDHVLQSVVGSEVMSMLDGYSGYNQISVASEDQHKTAFITPWSTFAYSRMPFGLINAGATFQRAMNSSFRDLRDKIIVIYLDDLTVYSKRRKHHLRDLERVLERCRQHGISLNPKKSVFFVEEGKLLGHIVSREGIRIDPERVKAIQSLILPTNRSDLKSFFSQINFLRSFVLEFSEKVRYMLEMMS